LTICTWPVVWVKQKKRKRDGRNGGGVSDEFQKTGYAGERGRLLKTSASNLTQTI